LITAENNYETAKAQLNQAMGVESTTDFDLGEGSAEPIDLEDAPIGALVDVAAKDRPELAAFEERLRAEALVVRASKWGYAPTLSASTSIADRGPQIDSLVWNWNFQAALSWQLFSGLLTFSQVKEAEAQLASLTAQ